MTYLQASARGLAGLGQAPAPKVSAGQYGLALSRIRIPALDRIFESDCAKKSLFAISGVSGGSIGSLPLLTGRMG